MENIQYDLDKTQLLINEINEMVDKINLNVDQIYNEINKMDLNLIWLGNSSTYVKNKGLLLADEMEKELVNLRLSINQVVKNVEIYKQIDSEVLKNFVQK